MAAEARGGLRWGGALAVALAVHAGAGVLVWRSMTPLRPTLECVQPNPDGTYTAVFGYLNEEPTPIALPVGPSNGFSGSSGGEIDRGQPRVLLPGRHQKAFEVRFRGGELVWRLDKREARATPESPACEKPEPKMVASYDVGELIKLKPIEPPPPEPPSEPPPEPPPEPPKEEAPPPKEEAKPNDAPAPTRKPKNHIQKRGQPKQTKESAQKPAADAPKSEPAPLVLENVNLTGGMNVQKGEQDIFGDPSVAANERNTNVEKVDDPSAVPDKVGSGGGTPGGSGKAPVWKKPRVKVSVEGKYPEDAPRLGRTVRVRLSVLVGVDGRVKEVKFVERAGGAFDREARRVAMQLVFEPATRDGEPAEMWIPWPVEFQPEG